MKTLNLLHYSSSDSGPIGYKTRIGLIAVAPIGLLAMFVPDLRIASIGVHVLFWAAVIWLVAIVAFGVWELLGVAGGNKRG